MGLHIHSPIRLHGVVLNQLSTVTTLPFYPQKEWHIQFCQKYISFLIFSLENLWVVLYSRDHKNLRTSALKHSCTASYHVTPLFQVQFNQYLSQGCTGYINRAAPEPQHVLQLMGVRKSHCHQSSTMFSPIRNLSSALHIYNTELSSSKNVN
jgi:hypothetical protein